MELQQDITALEHAIAEATRFIKQAERAADELHNEVANRKLDRVIGPGGTVSGYSYSRSSFPERAAARRSALDLRRALRINRK